MRRLGRIGSRPQRRHVHIRARRDACRARIALRLDLDAERRLAHPDRLAALQRRRGVDPPPVDEGPVRRAEVLDRHPAVHDADRGVAARGLLVGQRDRGVLASQHDLALELEAAAHQRAGLAYESGHRVNLARARNFTIPFAKDSLQSVVV